MRILDQVHGHEKIISKLLNHLIHSVDGKVFLFAGPSGIGKRKTAWGIAQALLCEKSNTACGECGSCQRVEKKQSEGVLEISPEGLQIKTEQADEVIHFLSLKKISKFRIVILDEANLLNQYAANSLLKIMEEPPENTIFFLIVPTSLSVLPTIRSRSQIIAFNPVREEQMNVSAPDWVKKNARGSYEKLYKLMDQDEQDFRSRSIEILRYFISDRDFLLNENWRDAFRDRKEALSLLGYWGPLFKDAIALKNNQKEFISNTDQMQVMQELTQKNMNQLIDYLDGLILVQREIPHNLDMQLLVEKYWVNCNNIRV